jgi:hypothetical protein
LAAGSISGRLVPAVSERQNPEAMYKPGDRVVYIASKHSAHPGPRAEAVQPEQHGEGYWYDVKKYWLVVQVLPGGALTVVTRRGKERSVAADDPRLRPANWWETLFFRGRFPQSNVNQASSSAKRPSAA